MSEANHRKSKDFWFFGFLISWYFGFLVLWFCGFVVFWFCDLWISIWVSTSEKNLNPSDHRHIFSWFNTFFRMTSIQQSTYLPTSIVTNIWEDSIKSDADMVLRNVYKKNYEEVLNQIKHVVVIGKNNALHLLEDIAFSNFHIRK